MPLVGFVGSVGRRVEYSSSQRKPFYKSTLLRSGRDEYNVTCYNICYLAEDAKSSVDFYNVTRQAAYTTTR
jgi:hypothetical protein